MDLEPVSRQRRDQRALALWAAACAERVLAQFERASPYDDRPRRAIEAARAWARGELSLGEARARALRAHAAARSTESETARAAARAAGHAAATAHAAGHARHAAACAAASVAATSNGSAVAAQLEECEWQTRQLPSHLLAAALPRRDSNAGAADRLPLDNAS
ncbi:MAG TPA: hypothetical protein VMG12_32795 [Polyangiaceae bacterium]|nr:hypothetical protein [Polyangiaceae bacterium]